MPKRPAVKPVNVPAAIPGSLPTPVSSVTGGIPRGETRSFNEVTGKTTVVKVVDGRVVTEEEDGDTRLEKEPRGDDELIEAFNSVEEEENA